MSKYTVELIKNLLSVSYNGKEVGNFKYGSLNAAPVTTEQSIYHFELVEENFIEKKHKNSMTFYNITGSNGSEIAHQTRKIGVFGVARMEFERLLFGLPRIKYNNLFRLWTISRIAKMQNVGENLTDFVTLRLLHNNILSFHGGAFSHNDKCYILTGLPDMGKTYTTMKILESCSVEYMSEDILLIDHEQTAYSVPYTQTVEKRKKLTIFETIISKIYNFFLRINYVKTDVMTAMPEVAKRQCDKSQVDTIFFLKRGKAALELADNTELVLNELTKLNNLEFGYSRNEQLLTYLYFNSEKTIADYMEIEQKLLQKLVENKKIVTVYGEDHTEYAPQIIRYLEL